MCRFFLERVVLLRPMVILDRPPIRESQLIRREQDIGSPWQQGGRPLLFDGI
jgi:hypothetical protein